MPEIKLPDISLKDYNFTDPVSHLRNIYFRAMPKMCIERPRLTIRLFSIGAAEVMINLEEFGATLAIGAYFFIGAVVLCF